MHACPRDCSTHVVRARRQSANACRHRQCRMNVDKEPCDKTTGRNCPKSALYLVAIACASTFFPHGERTCAGAPCLVSITLARSHVGAITLDNGLLHFCAILMMRKRYFLTALSKNTTFPRIASYVAPSTASKVCQNSSPGAARSVLLNNTIRDRTRKPRCTN